MKSLFTISFLLSLTLCDAQTFITMAGGTSTKSDVAIHAAIGYHYEDSKHERWYEILSVEAGFIGAPLNTNRPLFITGLLTADLPLSDNWTMIPIAGAAIRTWEPGKNDQVKTGAYIGARLQWKDIFIQAAHTDKTYFFSIGLKGFFNNEF